jgi:hypothetical protein
MRHHLRIAIFLALGASLAPASSARATLGVCTLIPASVTAVAYPARSAGGIFVPAHVGVRWTMAADIGGCAPLVTPDVFNVFYVGETPPQIYTDDTSHFVWSPTPRFDSFLAVPRDKRYSFCVTSGKSNTGGGVVLNFTAPRCSEYIWAP